MGIKTFSDTMDSTMRDSLNHKQGFTLIELLVVIAIIGLVSGAVFATFNSTREAASYAQLQGDAAANFSKFLGDCYNSSDTTLLCGAEYYSFDDATSRFTILVHFIPDVDMDTQPNNRFRVFGTLGENRNREAIRTIGTNNDEFELDFVNPGFHLRMPKDRFLAGVEYEMLLDVQQITAGEFNAKLYINGILELDTTQSGVLDGHTGSGVLQVGQWTKVNQNTQVFPGSAWITGIFWQ